MPWVQSSSRLRHLPTHVGVVMDGNRRWARAVGHSNASVGHKVGAEHMEDLLAWCVASEIRHLTVYVLSADNIRKRSAREVGFLFGLLADTLPDLVRQVRGVVAVRSRRPRDVAGGRSKALEVSGA